MKIAFVGTVCAGKTTLLEACRSAFERRADVAYVEEVARRFFETNQDTPHLAFETQALLQRLIIAEEQKAAVATPKIILCDRSVLDAIPYTEVGGNPEGAQALRRGVRAWLPTYERFFLLDPTDIPYAADRVRTESSEDRLALHQAFVRTLDDLRVPYELLSGSVDDRLARVRLWARTCLAT